MEKSFGLSVGGGVFGGKPRTLTFRSTRSESMRIVSTLSCAAATPHKSSIKKTVLNLKNLVRIIPTFAARYGVSATDADSNRSPLSIACAVCCTIRQTVHRSKIRDDLLVSTREIRQFFHFVEHAAARVSHFFHAIVAGVECFRLRILRIHRLVFGVQPQRV